MPDLLRERFEALRDATDATTSGGLADVRARRSRRARTQIASITAAAVAAVAIGGAVVIPGWGAENTTSASAGGGAEVFSDSAGDAGSDRVDDADDEINADTAPAEEPEGLPTLTADSLLTAPELASLGEVNPQPADGQGPAFPPLCGAVIGAQQYSDPTREFFVGFSVTDAMLSQYAAEYASVSVATQAMDRLLTDAQNCPETVAGGQLSVSSRTQGEVLVLTYVEPTAGPAGAPRFTDITVLRSANVLFEVALIPAGMGLPDGAERTGDVAVALAAKL